MVEKKEQKEKSNTTILGKLRLWIECSSTDTQRTAMFAWYFIKHFHIHYFV